MQIGLMLPHFGSLATRERVVERAPLLERWGFASVWVRDHLTFQPHGFEPYSTTFFEPFTTLTAIAAITQRLVLGTATVIPWRHPLITSQLYGGISAIAGPGRLIAGLGAGAYRLPFDAAGTSFERRTEQLVETAQVLRRTWQEKDVVFHGELFPFDAVTIDPHPPGDTPIWIGGSTPASVKRAVEFGDGWMPGRLDQVTFDRLLTRLRQAGEERGRRYALARMPVVSLGKSREAALRDIDLDGLLDEARKRSYWKAPIESVDDLEGILIYGSAADCVEQISKLGDEGIDHLILDLRLRIGDYDEQLEWLAEEVLPEL